MGVSVLDKSLWLNTSLNTKVNTGLKTSPGWISYLAFFRDKM